MRWGSWGVTVGVLVMALVAGGATPVSASAGQAPPTGAVAQPLPSGWIRSSGGSSPTWTAPRPLPILDAVIDVQVDGRIVAGAKVAKDRRSLSISLPATAIRDTSTLQVVAAGRRLDTTLGAAAQTRPPDSGQVPDTPFRQVVPSAQPLISQVPLLPDAQDPGVAGPYRIAEAEYQLTDLPVDGLDVPAEMRAVVVGPVGARDRRPVALFLHGRHATCYLPGSSPTDYTHQGAWPCPQGWEPIPSFRGFLTSQRLLASQGWITISISANAINAHDDTQADAGATVRSQLIRAHLAALAAWARSDTAWATAPPAVRSGPRPDLDRVLLVGHSRGGEGVNRASLDSNTGQPVPWQIRAQVLIEPTSARHDPAPVATEVILGGCDGDQYRMDGQYYVDNARDVMVDHAPRSVVYVEGANHNFFNAEWTPGLTSAPAVDDWDFDGVYTDKPCGTRTPTRLTAAQQRTVGAVYTAAAAQALVERREAVLLVDPAFLL